MKKKELEKLVKTLIEKSEQVPSKAERYTTLAISVISVLVAILSFLFK